MPCLLMVRDKSERHLSSVYMAIMDILLPASVAQDHFIATAEAQER